MKMQTEHKILLLFCLFVLLVPNVAASAQSPIPPDRAQQVLNLLAIESQNLYDFANRIASGDGSAFESVQKRFSVSIENFSYLMGDFHPELIGAFWEIYNNFLPDAGSANETALRCQQLRQTVYQYMSAVDGILNPPQSISTYTECIEAGYYAADGTCFIGGNLVYDGNGYITGLYNADCFDAQSFYQGSCWYCEYGNNMNGCNDRP